MACQASLSGTGCLQARILGCIGQYWLSYPSAAAAAAKSLQSCPTLCDPRDGNPPGSPVPGILQARTLELVAISFSNAWKWKVKVKSLSCVLPSATPWTAAFQAPTSMGFSRQEYWSGVPLPSLPYTFQDCFFSFHEKCHGNFDNELHWVCWWLWVRWTFY